MDEKKFINAPQELKDQDQKNLPEYTVPRHNMVIPTEDLYPPGF